MNIQTLPLPPATELAQRLEGILASFALLVFGRIFILGDLAARLHNRFGRVRRRLALLLATLAAGRPPRTYPPRPSASDGARKCGPYALALSRRRAWVITTFGHHAAGYASQLEFLLRDPQTLAFLADAPPAALKSLGRTLRPLSHILGVALPSILQASPRPRRPKPPPRKPTAPPKPAESPALSPLRPLYPRRYAREMPLLFPPRKNRPA